MVLICPALSSVSRFCASLFSVLLMAVLLQACDSPEDVPTDHITLSADQAVQSGANGTGLTVSLPERLRNASAIDPAAVRAIALVNGIETELQRNADGQYVASIQVPARTSLTFSIQFFELYAGQRLMLASTEQLISTGTQNTTINLQRGDYEFDIFDSDNDSVSNIVERENDTSPLDSSQRPDLMTIEVLAARPPVALNAGFTDYLFEVTAGSVTNSLAANIGDYRNTFQIASVDPLNVTVRLIEQTTGQGLVIGSQARTLTGDQLAGPVVFLSNQYELGFDSDSDGVSNINELIAGTDLLAGQSITTIPFSITFDVPPVITNPDSVFAVMLLNGQTTNLSRTGNTYTANAQVQQGATVDIDVTINDTFQNQVVALATFTATVQPVAAQQLELREFSLALDSDSDGTPNYLELAQGTDPFNAVLQCTPVTEELQLALVDDAWVNNNNGRLFDDEFLRVDRNQRSSLIRYQYDASQGIVTTAVLSLTVGPDAGDGVVSVSVLQNFEWSDMADRLDLPELGVPVVSLNEQWNIGDEFRFNLPPSVITRDFTLVLTQESEGSDIAFNSSDTIAPPELSVMVERCE